MMKIYRCDGKECSLESETVDHWLSLGSKNNSLFFENGKRDAFDGGLISLGGHRDIHFCSKRCFISYFFGLEPNNRVENL